MGSCQRCGAAFTCRQTSNLPAYCSPRCSRAEAADRRRALKAQVESEPIYRMRVLKRDKWVCHLCGKRTTPNKVAPHPAAPVLDHVVPLSKGGSHTMANLRCAHFLCNSLKGDRATTKGEQLRLVG